MNRLTDFRRFTFKADGCVHLHRNTRIFFLNLDELKKIILGQDTEKTIEKYKRLLEKL